MELLKKIPLFLLLLALFFCLHGSVENFGSLTVNEVFVTGLSVFGVTMLLYVMVYLCARKYLFAALVTFFIALWYFFFGAIHDFIKEHHFLSLIKRYIVLIPLLCILTAGWVIFLKKKPGVWQKLSLYLNILLSLYCLLDLSKIVRLTFQKTRSAPDVVFDYAAVKQKPDVYFLLFDGYPGHKSLKDSFDFDNPGLDSILRENSMVLLPSSSNYDLTVYSMSSIFNMNYVDSGKTSGYVNQRDIQKRQQEIKNASVFSVWKHMGYRVENNSIFDIGNTSGVSQNNSFLMGHSILLTDKILVNRVNREVAPSLPKYVLKWLPFLSIETLYGRRNDNARIEELFFKHINGPRSAEPLFYYLHLLLPHESYYYDSSGREVPPGVFNKPNAWENRDEFISYVKYTNTKIRSIVKSIREKRPAAVIVLLSDHGYRYYNGSDDFQDARFNNICAVYFPNKNYGSIEAPLTNINFFPYLFATQFGQRPVFRENRLISVHFENTDIVP